jgi:hypothetical protein
VPLLSTSVDARAHLVRALEADLIGPFDLDRPDAVEDLPLPPSRWYLTGFLAPEGAGEADEPPDDELDAGSDEDDDDCASEKPDPKPRARIPASLGRSVLLPPGDTSETVSVTVRYADYLLVPHEAEGEEDRRKKGRYRRAPRPPVTMELPLDPARLAKGFAIPESRGIYLLGQLQSTSAPGLPQGARALALFVVNRRGLEEAPGQKDEQSIFQVALSIRFARGLLPRPHRRGGLATDEDDQTADLQYRRRMEYAVGHSVSVEIEPAEDGLVRGARTCWIPCVTVPRVVTREIADVKTEMDVLGALPDGEAARRLLTPLLDEYRGWIEAQRAHTATDPDVDTHDRKNSAETLLLRAERCLGRIAAGLDLLAADPEVLAAFKLANRAMAEQARRRNPDDYKDDKKPRWRLFQLAFLLLNLPGVAVDGHEDRDAVELIFFPTGGGKTEAYLGVIALTLLLRRLRGASRPDRGLGVAVLLRYTLRLLTLDQLARAATLVCALEMLRRAPPADVPEAKRLGEVRFSIGLWPRARAQPYEPRRRALVVKNVQKSRGGRSTQKVQPEGKVRRSQVVTTYGPGAMVDLIDDAADMGLLVRWVG